MFEAESNAYDAWASNYFICFAFFQNSSKYA